MDELTVFGKTITDETEIKAIRATMAGSGMREFAEIILLPARGMLAHAAMETVDHAQHMKNVGEYEAVCELISLILPDSQ